MATSVSTTPLPAPPALAPEAVSILLVDDQPQRLLTYRTILGDLGDNLVEATSGAEALRLLMANEFALILLDVNMPGMDGFETASLIHEHPRFEKTPIIFVTAINLSDLDRMRGYRLGAFDYVMVPIIPEILRSKVATLVELYRKRRELEIANRELAAANDALVKEKARELAAINESLQLANQELASRNLQLSEEITERKRIESLLLEHDRRKDEFLAMLAHELRNPLASVANALSAFKLSTPTPHPLHEVMSRQMALLVRLIDDLLDVARIRRGKLALKRGRTTVNSVLDAAIETVAPMLTRGGFVLKSQLLADDVELDADHDRLSQVFSNLLSNAAKYSPPGSEIDLVALRDGDWLQISVLDRGVGLTDEQREWIFELFAQVDTSLGRSQSGLGIGLTLARHVVEMHDGELRAESAGLNQGSRFVVLMPVPSVVGEPRTDQPPAQVNTSMCRALVVDDNVDSADTLAMVLQLLGHQTRCVYDPLQVAEVVDAFQPDVLFLDLGMPGLSGYDVARQVRARADGKRYTLVALTGWGHAEDRRRTHEAGFDHHLVKPTNADTVRDICAGLRSKRVART